MRGVLERVAVVEYEVRVLAALQRADAPRGFVAFTALPVLLARATLDRVEEAGPGAKLTRLEVAGIVQQMNLDLDDGRSAIPAETSPAESQAQQEKT